MHVYMCMCALRAWQSIPIYLCMYSHSCRPWYECVTTTLDVLRLAQAQMHVDDQGTCMYLRAGGACVHVQLRGTGTCASISANHVYVFIFTQTFV